MRMPFAKRKPVHRYGVERMAAHQVATPSDNESMKVLSARLDGWQEKVMKFRKLIPEVNTGYEFVQNVMDLVTLEVQRFDRVTNEWTPDESPAMKGIERRLNTRFKMGRVSALDHLVHEAYILVTRHEGSVFEFETLAPTEIKSRGTTTQVRVEKEDGKTEWEDVAEGTTIIRVFEPSTDNRFEAGGVHQALLGLLETMAIELLRDQADGMSVLAGAGLLLIPTEILPDEVDTLDASETPGSRRGFEARLEDAMTAPITDLKRAELVVPVTVYGPAEHLGAVRHIIPKRSENAYEVGARMDRYVKRYASSIDLPSQVILGIGEANHWGDWKVDENTWAYHLRPRGQRVADAIYDGLVANIIANLGLDPSEYRLAPNAVNAIAKQDLSGNAHQAYRNGAIKPQAYVEAIGMQVDDMRDDAEEMLEILTGNIEDQQQAIAAGAGTRTTPDRTAASRNPRTILRQAGRAANQHQRRLEGMYGRILDRIAADAAKAGAAAQKAAIDSEALPHRTAGADLPHIPFVDYEPGTYFRKYSDELANGTKKELEAYLRRIATITGSDYSTLRTAWANEFAQRAAAVQREAERLSKSIERASFERGSAARVTPNAKRSLTSTANGGVQQSNDRAGNTSRPVHAGDDPAMRAALSDSVGSYVTQFTWVHGHPMSPFPPHEELDGTTWFSWEEFDALDTGGRDPWLPGATYFPGDHDGCTCEYEIDFVPSEEGAQ